MRKLLFIFLAVAALGSVWLTILGAPPVVRAEDPCLIDPTLPQCNPDPGTPVPPPSNTTPPPKPPGGQPPVINIPPGGGQTLCVNTDGSTTPALPNGSCPDPNAPNTGGGGSSGGNNTSGGLKCDPSYTAQNGLCLPQNPLGNVGGIAGSSTAAEFIAKVITILLYFAGIVAVIFAIYGGYQYMVSGGNEESATKGRNTLINAIIGLVIVILSYAIITAVTSFILTK